MLCLKFNAIENIEFSNKFISLLFSFELIYLKCRKIRFFLLLY